MERRDFLKFLALTPIAFILPKPSKGVAEPSLVALASVAEIQERIKAINEMKERYDLDQIKKQIEEIMRRDRFQERLNQKVREMLMGIG